MEMSEVIKKEAGTKVLASQLSLETQWLSELY